MNLKTIFKATDWKSPLVKAGVLTLVLTLTNQVLSPLIFPNAGKSKPDLSLSYESSLNDVVHDVGLLSIELRKDKELHQNLKELQDDYLANLVTYQNYTKLLSKRIHTLVITSNDIVENINDMRSYLDDDTKVPSGVLDGYESFRNAIVDATQLKADLRNFDSDVFNLLQAQKQADSNEGKANLMILTGKALAKHGLFIDGRKGSFDTAKQITEKTNKAGQSLIAPYKETLKLYNDKAAQQQIYKIVVLGVINIALTFLAFMTVMISNPKEDEKKDANKEKQTDTEQKTITVKADDVPILKPQPETVNLNKPKS